MRKVKKYLVVFVLLFSLLGFSKELNVWTCYGESTVEYKNFEAMGKMFEKETGIKIKWIPITDLTDLDSKLRVSAPAGVGPDLLVTVPHDSIGKWVKQNILKPVDSILAEELKNFTDSALMAVRYDGKAYGLPYTVESVGLVYNKKYVSQPPKDWSEIIQISEKLKSQGINGIVFPAGEAYHMYCILRGFSGYIFKWENNQYNIQDIGMNNEGAYQAIAFLKELFDRGILSKVLMDSSSMHSFSTGAFEEGKAAFQINGPWVIPGASKMGIDCGVVPIPKLPNGEMPKPFMGVQMIAFNNYSRNQTDALKFAKYITSHDNMLKFALETNRVVARKSVIDSQEIKSNPLISGWSQQAVYGEPMPNIPEMSVVWTAWKDSLPLMYSGKQDIQKTLDELVEVLHNKLKMMQE